MLLRRATLGVVAPWRTHLHHALHTNLVRYPATLDVVVPALANLVAQLVDALVLVENLELFKVADLLVELEALSVVLADESLAFALNLQLELLLLLSLLQLAVNLALLLAKGPAEVIALVLRPLQRIFSHLQLFLVLLLGREAQLALLALELGHLGLLLVHGLHHAHVLLLLLALLQLAVTASLLEHALDVAPKALTQLNLVHLGLRAAVV